MRRRFLASFFVATLVASATAVVVPTLGASAGGPMEQLEVGLLSATEPLVFGAFVADEVTCDSVSIIEVRADGVPVEPLAVVPDDTEPNLVFIVLPSDTAPGELEVDAECLDGETPLDYVGSFAWGALAVTKVVQGPAPADASFTVHVACDVTVMSEGYGDGVGAAALDPSADHDLDFDVAGGTKYVYFDTESTCTITEPVNGGADSTTITPDFIDNQEPGAYASTVTNVFAVAVEPDFTG